MKAVVLTLLAVSVISAQVGTVQDEKDCGPDVLNAEQSLVSIVHGVQDFMNGDFRQIPKIYDDLKQFIGQIKLIGVDCKKYLPDRQDFNCVFDFGDVLSETVLMLGNIASALGDYSYFVEVYKNFEAMLGYFDAISQDCFS